ncbi:hypothetical protein [Ornithinimicrobium flavum]|uniref:hypothetical protein n=1 Tax=Ornithinimicrobium flavum TaxID=1288636 RepID=UPI00187F4349|nr:hypothetical protein [Ornithinimicrobium flavum]
MSDSTTSTTQVDLLRAVRELADPAAQDAGSPVLLVALLESLLDCEAEALEAEALRTLPCTPAFAATGHTELVVDAAAGGVVHAGIRLRRPSARPFGEDDVVLVDLLRPHLSAWLSRRGDPAGPLGDRR